MLESHYNASHGIAPLAEWAYNSSNSRGHIRAASPKRLSSTILCNRYGRVSRVPTPTASSLPTLGRVWVSGGSEGDYAKESVVNYTIPDSTCPRCGVGRFRLALSTYVRMYGATLITVPNLPAWECDICHHRDYDSEVVQQIEVLISPAGPPPNRYQPPAVASPLPTHAVKRTARADGASPTVKSPAKDRAKIKG